MTLQFVQLYFTGHFWTVEHDQRAQAAHDCLTESRIHASDSREAEVVRIHGTEYWRRGSHTEKMF